jgi:hypothetical protein
VQYGTLALLAGQCCTDGTWLGMFGQTCFLYIYVVVMHMCINYICIVYTRALHAVCGTKHDMHACTHKCRLLCECKCKPMPRLTQTLHTYKICTCAWPTGQHDFTRTMARQQLFHSLKQGEPSQGRSRCHIPDSNFAGDFDRCSALAIL